MTPRDYLQELVSNYGLNIGQIDRIKRIRLMLFDVDGVLTDGKIIYLDNGVEMKMFDVQDGHGMKLLIRAGIEVGLITGRYCRTVERRAEEIGIKHVYQNAKIKLEALEQILARTGLKEQEVGYMGDDLIDIPVMKRVGWAVTVPNANIHVFPYAHHITRKSGGNGACREVCEILLKTKNFWSTVTERYFGDPGDFRTQ
ncbi:KdsC family phosphatase [Thermodesulforhabdus norvegica]|uniref:3-deoxy-D-manno-octulosonate 8-phosphate phosphatase (KDO 8-P phosphatase) n=1 Tax=Thermodesulforhabdus norvegica TaxID=39841 RepID=A0A1I4VJC7_9BACT|nr:HAD hydrolase family protein [Thermodesulforhabdus norvegica]SFN01156.1 3-deoxy-D-manno-octulosonate 8-phosphate phosphatase (KDO 8-P phosphatase) [Thermodesulforhabdus norvegica]